MKNLFKKSIEFPKGSIQWAIQSGLPFRKGDLHVYDGRTKKEITDWIVVESSSLGRQMYPIKEGSKFPDKTNVVMFNCEDLLSLSWKLKTESQ